MTKERLIDVINEEILIHKHGGISLINEEISERDEREIRDIIRQEVSAIFFDLFKKRKTWGA